MHQMKKLIKYNKDKEQKKNLHPPEGICQALVVSSLQNVEGGESGNKTSTLHKEPPSLNIHQVIEA